MSYTPLELAKLFLVLELHSETFDTTFLRSVVEAEDPSEKQLDALTRVVEALKLEEKINKYDCDGYMPFLNDELEYDDDNTNCYITGDNLMDEMCFLDTYEQKFMSVEAFKTKQRRAYVKKVKVKKSAKDLLAKK